MPASQHQSPKSDIEISQSAAKRRILDIAKEKLGIAPEHLDPYGHYKAKVSGDYIKSLKDKKSGKLILVTAISPAAATPRSSRWRTSTCTSPATSTPSPRRTISCRR